MSKKNVMPAISDEEFNSMIGMDYPHTGARNDTESSIRTDYGEITTPKSNPQLDYGEKRTKSEPTMERARKVANAVNAVRAANVTTGQTEPTNESTESTDEPTEHIAPAKSSGSIPSEIPSTLSAPATPDRQSEMTAPTPPELRRPSTKQRKASFEEYRESFLRAPKISDRQPVFLSRTTRDRLDEIVRRLGDRKMSVSGLLENIARHHLEAYAEDIEVWKRL